MKKRIILFLCLAFAVSILFLANFVLSLDCVGTPWDSSKSSCSQFGIAGLSGSNPVCTACGTKTYCDSFSGSGARICTKADSNCGPFKIFYRDADNDSFGNPSLTISSCSAPIGYVSNNTDCNDSNNAAHPNTVELCDNIDNNCINGIDEGTACIKINTPYWANLNGAPISSANKLDSVIMLAPGADLGGKLFNYTIQKDNNWFRGLLKWNSYIETSLTSVIWKIIDSGSLRFTVSSSNVQDTSSILLVSPGEQNSRPVASLISPREGDFVAINSPIEFRQNSSDSDDLLRIKWDFGSSSGAIFENYSNFLNNNFANFLHTYVSPGSHRIILEASEMTRGQLSSEEISIFALEPGINVVPVINSPLVRVPYRNWVVFNVSQTSIINCPNPLSGNSFIVGNLNCSYLHLPFTKTITGNYDILVNWTVYEGNRVVISRVGTWKKDYNTTVEFKVYFPQPKQRRAVVAINYVEN